MTETLEVWKVRKNLSDEDILTQEYLERISDQPPTQGNEIIYCACGCGKFWLRPHNHEGKRRRFIRGHSPPRRTRREIVQAIHEALPVLTFATVDEISKKCKVSWPTCRKYLDELEFELGLQGISWLKTVILGSKKGYRKEAS